MRLACFWAGLVILSGTGAFAQDLRWPPTPADRAKIIAEGWPAARDRLERQLLAYYQPGGPERPGSTGVSAYASWLLLWKWGELLSRPQGQTGTVAGGLSPAIVKEWLNDADFSRLLFANLSDSDDAPKVLQLLQEVRLAHPDTFRDYENLAIALAIVYDQPFPSDWPHGQVTPNLVPRKDIPVADQFAAWVKSNESNELYFDLRTLSPQELKFVVDAPLDPSEFAWAQKNVRFPRMDFGRAFSSVLYDEDRLRAGQYCWTNGEYTLANIMHLGGICIDQAYYAAIAGKAHGLPTLLFSGLGADGAHAWFGYMKLDGRWELDCGRYENQNYVTGETLDPQTWKPITDHELKALTQNFRGTPQFAAAEDDVLLAGVFARNGQMDRALRAAQSAVDVCPENVAAWKEKEALLVLSQAALQTRREFAEAAVKQFDGDRDLRVAFQSEVADLARQQGDTETADALGNDILSQNRGARSDLSIKVAATQLASLLESQQYDKAFDAYRGQLVRLGKTGGLAYFEEVVVPFVDVLKKAGNVARAQQALSMARRALNPEAESQMAQKMDDMAKSINRR